MGRFTLDNSPQCTDNQHSISNPMLLLQMELTRICQGLNTLASELNAHETKGMSTTDTSLHNTLSTYINGQIAVLDTTLRGLINGKTTENYVDNKIALPANVTVAAAVLAERGERVAEDEELQKKITAEHTQWIAADAAINSVLSALQGVSGLLNTKTIYVNELRAQLNEVIKTIKVANNVIIAKGSYIVGTQRIRGFSDFGNMTHIVRGQIANISAVIVPEHDTGKLVEKEYKDKPVMLLGVLSDDWSDPDNLAGEEYNIMSFERKIKSARAYVKFIDTESWDAVVDMSATYKNDSVSVGEANLQVLVSMTSKRDDLSFGLYKGTSGTGKLRIYLGVISTDTPNLSWLGYGDTPMPTVINNGYYVGGNNFIPFSADDATQRISSGVTQLAVVKYTKGTGSAYSNISVNGTLTTNHIQNTDKQDLVRSEKVAADPDANPPTPEIDIVTVGNVQQNLEIKAKKRPTVQLEDGGVHQLGFLTDQEQDTIWQDTETIIVENVEELETLYVYVTSDATGTLPEGTIVPKSYADANVSPTNKIRGFYTSVARGYTVTGYKLVEGDEALIKKAPVTYENYIRRLPDGKLNGLIVNGKEYDITLITEVNPTKIQTLKTTVVDNNGEYGIIKTITVDRTTVTIDSIEESALFAYHVPCYAVLTDDVWVVQNGFIDAVPLPITTDKIITDSTLKWHANAKEGTENAGTDNEYAWYVPADVLWTMHYQDMLLYAGRDWSINFTSVAGYRLAERQDVIDNVLESLALVQPDYAEKEDLTAFTRISQESVTNAGKKKPNPSFIHNKPWSGKAAIDGGSFNDTSVYYDWIVDGGDLSSTAPPPSPPDGQERPEFGNATIKLQHGKLSELPVVKNNDDATWLHHDREIVLIDMEGSDKRELNIINEKTRKPDRYIPAENFPPQLTGAPTIIGIPAENAATLNFPINDISVPGVLTNDTKSIVFKSTAETGTQALKLSVTDNVLNVTAPIAGNVAATDELAANKDAIMQILAITEQLRLLTGKVMPDIPSTDSVFTVNDTNGGKMSWTPIAELKSGAVADVAVQVTAQVSAMITPVLSRLSELSTLVHTYLTPLVQGEDGVYMNVPKLSIDQLSDTHNKYVLSYTAAKDKNDNVIKWKYDQIENPSAVALPTGYPDGSGDPDTFKNMPRLQYIDSEGNTRIADVQVVNFGASLGLYLVPVIACESATGADRYITSVSSVIKWR